MIQNEDCLFLSPERTPRHFFTLSGVSTYNLTPIRNEKRHLFRSPPRVNSIETSPESPMPWRSPDNGDFMKRGRPRATVISQLMTKGSLTDSPIRCPLCSRIFPREKSLSAHMRTHTGEKPYQCDYPKCGRAFCQSGQLKTHQRLHTGEQPFICTILDCRNRFTHANRHCSFHPLGTLARDEENMPIPALTDTNISAVARTWLIKFINQRETRIPYKSHNSEVIQPSKRALRMESFSEMTKYPSVAASLTTKASANPSLSKKRTQSDRNVPFVAEEAYMNLPIKKQAKFDVENFANSEQTMENDRLNGALALIQLANGCKMKP